MKVNRKIIFETRVGSYLYGTNGPDSDEDFLGIFLPSTDDMFGLQNTPSEWTMNTKVSDTEKNGPDDIDRKYFSLQKFLKLAAQGQSGPIEMLFSNPLCWLSSSDEWKLILSKRDMFLSKESITPIIGFATAQAHKATLKADNLNLIRRIITYIDAYVIHKHSAINNFLEDSVIFGEKLETWNDEKGMLHVRIAGRSWPVTADVGLMYRNLNELESKYGSRSENAAEYGYDYKSLMHAYRLIFEARELLTTGKISLPRPEGEITHLKNIRDRLYKADYFEEIEMYLTELRHLKEISTLPDKVNYSKIEQLCQEMLYNHLTRS